MTILGIFEELEHHPSGCGKLGDILAVRLPSSIVQAAALCEGVRVEVSGGPGEVIVRRVHRRQTAAELFASRSEQEGQAAYRDPY